LVLRRNYPFEEGIHVGDFDISVFHPSAPIHITKLILEYAFNNHSEDTPFPKGIRLESPSEGGFVTFSSEYPGAVGQGETEEDAIRDIQLAMELLKEEEKDPSGDVPWPEEFR